MSEHKTGIEEYYAIKNGKKLRFGYTTGTCAAAATKAAAIMLVTGKTVESVEIMTPKGILLDLEVLEPVLGENEVSCAIQKFSGDDPDATAGVMVYSKVSWSREPGIHIDGGLGVDRVTKPGLKQAVGEPAINPVPREMMRRELSALYDGGLDVTISVPGGRALAQKTFNPKLGVVDGISIIGTSGIVRPFSNEAFVEALRREIQVALAVGIDRLVMNSGAKSEQFLRARFPELPPQGFIHYGNFIGATLSLAAELGVRRVSMGIMLGKAVKLAEGHLDTHSRSVVMNREFLKGVAAESCCSPAVTAAIERLTLARELWAALSPEDGRRFFGAILSRCRTVCESVYPPSAGTLDILLLDEEGRVFEAKL